MGLLRTAANVASTGRFAFTRVRPLSGSLRLLHTVYGHHFGASEDLSGRRLCSKPYRRWYPIVLPPQTCMHLLLQVLREPVYEPLTPLRLAPLTILDCGANIGMTTLYLADRFAGSVVHAFEPSGSNHQALTTNTRLLGDRVVSNQVGVAAASGHGTLHLGEQSELHSLRPGLLRTPSSGSETVRLIRLDAYLEEQRIDWIDLLKLDIEGAELDALQGLGARITDVGVLVGELHLAAVGEEEFSSFLERNGFTFAVRSRPERHIVMFEAANRNQKRQ